MLDIKKIEIGQKIGDDTVTEVLIKEKRLRIVHAAVNDEFIKLCKDEHKKKMEKSKDFVFIPGILLSRDESLTLLNQ